MAWFSCVYWNNMPQIWNYSFPPVYEPVYVPAECVIPVINECDVEHRHYFVENHLDFPIHLEEPPSIVEISNHSFEDKGSGSVQGLLAGTHEANHQETVPESDENRIDCRPMQNPCENRFFWEVSNRGSLLLEDQISRVSMFVSADRNVCGFFHPFGVVLLTGAGKIHTRMTLPGGQQRFAKIDEKTIRFSGRKASANQIGIVYLLDDSGVKTAFHQLSSMSRLSAKAMFDRCAKGERRNDANFGRLVQSPNSTFSTQRSHQKHFTVRNDWFLFDNHLDLRISITKKSVSLKMPSFSISSSERGCNKGHIYVRRYLRDRRVFQKIYFDCQSFRVRQNRQQAELNVHNQLVLSRE